MNRIFSFATGNLWQWTDSPNRNVLLDFIKPLDVAGVELTFSNKEELFAFQPTKANVAWLKSLEHVTIHAPFWMCKPEFIEVEVEKQFEVISRLYRQLNAKNVVVHPEKELFDTDLLNQCDFRISTENLPQRKFKITNDDLAFYLEKFPNMGLCLDVAHAYLEGKDETSVLVDRFKDRISQIHFSGTFRRQDHQSLQIVSKNFLRSIKPIKNLPVPIVIEENMEVTDLETVAKEIEFIKALLN